MFDKYTVGRTEFVPYEKSVRIERQSTAEDARLLKDLEKEAEKKLTADIIASIGDNGLNGAIVSQIDYRTQLKKYYAVFNLNGKEYKVQVDQRDFGDKSKEDKLQELYHKFSDAIAETLIVGNYRDL